MKKFSLFLILSLSLTAFLIGYLFIGEGLGSGSKSKTGTILDKFEGQTSDNGTLSTEDEPSIPFIVTSRRTVSLTSSRDKNSILYYEQGTGKLFEFSFDDKTERVISDTVLPNFISSTWSPNKKEAVRSFYSQSGRDYRHYSLNTDRTTRLDPNIQSLVFSSDGNAIVYYYLEEETNELAAGGADTSVQRAGKIIIAQTDGQYPKKILDTRIKDLEVTWPAKNQIVLKTLDYGIYILTEEGGLTKFMEPMGLLQERWSPSGKKMLFSALTDERTEPLLWIKDLETREEKPLNIAGEASKCVWSIDDINIICALMKSPSIDELYQINTSSSSRELIAEPEMPLKEVLLSGTEDYLIIQSASDQKLYGIKIP
ncbi:MAG: hypothetical protein Q7S43_04095 [bacterium]|nr:hypothetical protein [bacterium]